MEACFCKTKVDSWHLLSDCPLRPRHALRQVLGDPVAMTHAPLQLLLHSVQAQCIEQQAHSLHHPCRAIVLCTPRLMLAIVCVLFEERQVPDIALEYFEPSLPVQDCPATHTHIDDICIDVGEMVHEFNTGELNSRGDNMHLDIILTKT
jgi:hypothetical protein